MAIVDIVQDGATTFVFHDDYCKDVDPEEIKRAMGHIAQIALPHVIAAERALDKKTG